MPKRDLKEGQFDRQHPGNVSPMVVWLGSKESKDVTGRVFETMNGGFGTYNGWERAVREKFDHRLDPKEMGPIVERMLAQTHPLSKLS